MRRRTWKWWIALGVAAAGTLLGVDPGSLSAQVITGRIVDRETGTGISNASVEVFDAEGGPLGSVSTDGTGGFRIQLPAVEGPVRLDARAFAYRVESVADLTLIAGETLALPEISLEPVPILLDGVEVEVSRSWITPGREWVRRGQVLGEGVFFAGALVAMENPSSLTQYLAESAGLRVTYNFANEPYLRSPNASNPCIRVQVNRWPLATSPYQTLDRIPLDIIAAIEVYPTSREVPPDLAWDADRCGLVNIWTWNRY